MLCITLISCVKIPSIESDIFPFIHSYLTIHIRTFRIIRIVIFPECYWSYDFNPCFSLVDAFTMITHKCTFLSKVNIQIILQIACRQAVSLYMVRLQFIHNVFIFTLLDGDWLRNATFCRKHQIILLKHNMLFFSGQKNRQDGR